MENLLSDYNMALELSNALLAISISIMGGLVTIVWWGVRVFTNNVKELKDSVNQMSNIMGVVQERLSNLKEDMYKNDTAFDCRMKDILIDIFRLDSEVSELKRELEIIKAIENERRKK